MSYIRTRPEPHSGSKAAAFDAARQAMLAEWGQLICQPGIDAADLQDELAGTANAMRGLLELRNG